jgi:hypothetical protein
LCPGRKEILHPERLAGSVEHLPVAGLDEIGAMLSEEREKLLEEVLRDVLVAHNTGWELSTPTLEETEENKQRVIDAAINMGRCAVRAWSVLGGYPDSEIERIERVSGHSASPEIRAQLQSPLCYVPEEWDKLKEPRP